LRRFDLGDPIVDTEHFPRMIETKEECKTFLFIKGEKRQAIGPYHATLHLFDHRYDAKTSFWHGVALVGCTNTEIDQDARAAGFNGPGQGYIHNPQAFTLRVELPDGRWGAARIMNGHLEEGVGVEPFTKIAFVGETALTMKPEGARAY
jgi:hypothetical protein